MPLHNFGKDATCQFLKSSESLSFGQLIKALVSLLLRGPHHFCTLKKAPCVTWSKLGAFTFHVKLSFPVNILFIQGD